MASPLRVGDICAPVTAKTECRVNSDRCRRQVGALEYRMAHWIADEAVGYGVGKLVDSARRRHSDAVAVGSSGVLDRGQ